MWAALDVHRTILNPVSVREMAETSERDTGNALWGSYFWEDV